MSEVITKPGFYRTQDGEKAEVVGQASDGRWLGILNGAAWWNSDGQLFCGIHRPGNITGPWHDPPTPPDGFQLMPRKYLPTGGDMFCDAGGPLWKPIYSGGTWVNRASAEWLDENRTPYAPHYIASPIPKPFRISEHGVGVYETRDGRELKVVSRCGPQSYPWCGEQAIYRRQWSDSGKRFHNRDVEDDLVRYIGPLPAEKPQEPWTCTGELRWNNADEACQARDAELDYARKAIKTVMVLEQRWTRGTEEEWRPVPVTQ